MNMLIWPKAGTVIMAYEKGEGVAASGGEGFFTKNVYPAEDSATKSIRRLMVPHESIFFQYLWPPVVPTS